MDKTVDALIEKAISDPEFRTQLFDDPIKAVTEYGFQLTNDQLAALSSMDREELRSLAEDLDERLSKGCCYTCGGGCTLG